MKLESYQSQFICTYEARVTEERNKLKERYESFVKQQGEVQFVDRLGKEPTTTFQDKATSPRELKWKGKRRLPISITLNSIYVLRLSY